MNAKAKTVGHLTQDNITAFVKGIDKDEAKGVSERLQVFAKQAVITTPEDFKQAVKDAAKAAESTGDKVLVTRLSEVRQLYGAIHNADFSVSGLGYHEAVKQARSLLNEKGIKFDGSHKLSPEESAKARQQRLMAQASKEVTKDFDFGQKNALEIFANKVQDKANAIQEQQDKERAERAMSKIKAHAESIYKQYGEVYSTTLAATLVDVVNANNTTIVAVASKVA